MSDLREAMRAAVALDEADVGAAAFAEAHGASVARRVRTRRTVRAAGYGTVATASAGVLAFGALQWARATEPASPTPAWCVPLDDAIDLPLMDADGIVASAGGMLEAGGGQARGGTFHYEVTEHELTVSVQPPDEELVFEIVGRQLIGPDGPTDEPLAVTFPSGRTATLQLVWTEERLEVGFGLGDDMVFGTADGFPQAGPADVPGSWTPEFLFFSITDTATQGYSGLLIDKTRGHTQARVDVAANGEVDVLFRDGTSASFDAGADGVATFEWAGYGVVSVDPAGEAGPLLSGAAITVPVDATISGPVICEAIVLGDPSDGMKYIDLVEPAESGT